MFNAIRKLLARRAAPAPLPALDDIPAHRGFTVITRYNAMVYSETFPTLKQAQQAVVRSRKFAAEVAHRTGWPIPPRTYRIRNLETGRFAPIN